MPIAQAVGSEAAEGVLVFNGGAFNLVQTIRPPADEGGRLHARICAVLAGALASPKCQYALIVATYPGG